MPRLGPAERASFERDGFVVVRGLLPVDDARDFRRYVENLLLERSRAQDGARHAEARYWKDGRPAIIKITQLTETDARFQALASRDEIVDVIEDLLGPGARIFRDALIVKPAGSKGLFSYHQDAAYWDVDPPRFASCWMAISDVPENGSCLRVIAGPAKKSVVKVQAFGEGCRQALRKLAPNHIRATRQKLGALESRALCQEAVELVADRLAILRAVEPTPDSRVDCEADLTRSWRFEDE